MENRPDPLWHAIEERHLGQFTTAEFLKAVRALSARYVERRAELGRRTPTDSAGKRAAFAAFYAPLHYFTTREIVRALGEAARAPRAETILDLGCGTGVAGAAWALELDRPVALAGVDTDAWALAEAAWTWRTLGLTGRSRRGSLLESVERLATRLAAARPEATGGSTTAVIAGWSVNELAAAERARLLPRLLECASRGAPVLVIEPLATSAAPWWNEWSDAVGAAGGRADTWRFDATLPPRLAELDEAAGFRREALTARSLLVRKLPHRV